MASGSRGVNIDQATWRAFLAASYFTIPEGKCTTCENKQFKCGLYFCVQCKVGGVCKATFQEGGTHSNHPHLRVWRVTKAYAVWVEDLKRFMSEALIDHIQLYAENYRLNCKFFGRDSARSSLSQHWSKLKMCRGCNLPISATSTPNQSASPVCSLQCILDYAQRNGGQRRRRRKQNPESISRVVRQ